MTGSIREAVTLTQNGSTSTFWAVAVAKEANLSFSEIFETIVGKRIVYD